MNGTTSAGSVVAEQIMRAEGKDRLDTECKKQQDWMLFKGVRGCKPTGCRNERQSLQQRPKRHAARELQGLGY